MTTDNIRPAAGQWGKEDRPGTRTESERQFFDDAPGAKRRLTHYLFRFPAKFHPPVARALLERYADPELRVLDPFCGSGTLLVEAAVLGRAALGTDVDPLAVFVSKVKSSPLRQQDLTISWACLWANIRQWRRSPEVYERFRFEDLSNDAAAEELRRLRPPAIPNLYHWFRRYVVVDLVQIRHEILRARLPSTHTAFFMLCFASIIRACSNADPVPISGLEVTAYMKGLDKAGRTIDPFALLERAAKRAIRDMGDFQTLAPKPVRISGFVADARLVTRRLRAPIGSVITSPPYHGAVDYYRRHQLEMFWLGLTDSQHDRLELLKRYIGRPKVPMTDPLVQGPQIPAPKARALELLIRAFSPTRADAFKHYCLAMHQVFRGLASALPTGAPAVFVVGHSSWNGGELDTSELFSELAGSHFDLNEVLSYPVTNRYMSYSRHNGANIDREYVLVLRRNKDRAIVAVPRL